MSKEKLIEEIAYLLSRHRFTSRDVGIVGADRDYAREAITCIGKAYADGLELPREEWRGPAEDMDSVALLTYDGIIIGLRKEENK